VSRLDCVASTTSAESKLEALWVLLIVFSICPVIKFEIRAFPSFKRKNSFCPPGDRLALKLNWMVLAGIEKGKIEPEDKSKNLYMLTSVWINKKGLMEWGKGACVFWSIEVGKISAVTEGDGEA
jgi:hypothetical protein